MKYADKVIELMGAYPGREFEMREIVRYVKPGATVKEKHTIRRSVLRVMQALVDSGSVLVREARVSGSRAVYWWKA